ncbi:DNA adenine methylase [Shewanella japonica]|uniref:site-specific DNA-methyltransferase (adenine-specific) n=1 Tax=Shewanella japonica TaxID=93973 RepID=A0ABN4Y9M8_9GAMM|nr:DNA adenine methylase [Shewanella japonica]ARD21136.1 DNA methyltransferase [Shewanella japonica]
MNEPRYTKDAIDSLKSQRVIKSFELPKLKSNLSPFRYPGGKGKLSKFLAVFLASNDLKGTKFVEPFCGGAGGSLPLLEAGVISKLVLNDANPFIAEFWHAAINNTKVLSKEIRKVNVNLETWHKYKAIFEGSVDASDIEKALSVFFLNRTNRSGILHAGPIGGQAQNGEYLIDCRFNKDNLIERVENIAKFKRKTIVTNEDASSLVFKLKQSNCFIYADPPYVKEGKNIYKKYCFNDHQHTTFANAIKHQKNPWLISYDDAPLVHELYAKSGINVIELSYVMNKAKVGRELLIASSNLNMPNLNSQVENISDSFTLTKSIIAVNEN